VWRTDTAAQTGEIPSQSASAADTETETHTWQIVTWPL